MIDQRFLDDLAQDLKLPEDTPTPEMQLASANTGVTTDGGAFVGYRMNMPKGLNTPENMAKQSTLIADTMAGGGKGAIQGFVGLPGDLESIGRMALGYLGYNVDENTALPTSEEIGKRLESVLGPVIPPGQTTGVPTEERVRAAEGGELGGELLAPGGQLKVAGKVIKATKDLPVGMSIKAVDESLDPLGFYSAASKAVDNIAQDKGTGAQFLAQIEKTPGVKKEELLWTGLDDYLKGKKSVTKAEVQEFLNANRVEVKEVTLAQDNPYPYRNANDWQNAINREERFGNFDEAERIMAAWERFELGSGDSGADMTKFAKYTMPGGENYREILLTLPGNKAKADNLDDAFKLWMADAKAGKRGQYSADELASITVDDVQDILKEEYLTPSTKGEFRSQHFDQPNVLAHMRVNDRVDADGKKVLFVEEVQSDWHQAGRKKGYETPEGKERRAELKAQLGNLENESRKLRAQKNVVSVQEEPQIVARLEEINNEVRESLYELNSIGDIPDAPFKTSWHELALKRAIQLASEGGYDRIAFTTGKTQAERYDLSKQVENVIAVKNAEGKYDVSAFPYGQMSIERKNITIDQVQDLIGKDLAKKIESQDVGSSNQYTGLDLQVGGEGMKGFYDTILPKYLDKYGKKWDAKTGTTNIRLATDKQDMADSELLGELGLPKGGKAMASVHYMDITPKMKESVLTKGQPLFQMAPAIPAGVAAGQQEENQ
jgi:hypothetical protein